MRRATGQRVQNRATLWNRAVAAALAAAVALATFEKSLTTLLLDTMETAALFSCVPMYAIGTAVVRTSDFVATCQSCGEWSEANPEEVELTNPTDFSLAIYSQATTIVLRVLTPCSAVDHRFQGIPPAAQITS